MVAEKFKDEDTKIIDFETIQGGKADTKTENKGVNPGIDAETRWVSPIKDRNDVARCIFHLRTKIECAYRKDTKLAAWRNWLLFVLGINIGLRVSDLTKLQWKHIFKPDMKTFVDLRNKKEIKTGKMKYISPNTNMKNAILKYLEETGIQPKYNDFVFLNARTGEPIKRDAVEKMMKELQNSLELEDNYNTHSLRKTYAWQKFMSYIDAGDPELLSLSKVQKDLNHRNSLDTATYLGITREEKIRSSYALGDMYEDLLGEDWVNKTDFPEQT